MTIGAAAPFRRPRKSQPRAIRSFATSRAGPYAAAHIMMLFGRCSLLVLDSWMRPRYAQLVGKKTVSDR